MSDQLWCDQQRAHVDLFNRNFGGKNKRTVDIHWSTNERFQCTIGYGPSDQQTIGIVDIFQRFALLDSSNYKFNRDIWNVSVLCCHYLVVVFECSRHLLKTDITTTTLRMLCVVASTMQYAMFTRLLMHRLRRKRLKLRLDNYKKQILYLRIQSRKKAFYYRLWKAWIS